MYPLMYRRISLDGFDTKGECEDSQASSGVGADNIFGKHTSHTESKTSANLYANCGSPGVKGFRDCDNTTQSREKV